MEYIRETLLRQREFSRWLLIGPRTELPGAGEETPPAEAARAQAGAGVPDRLGLGTAAGGMPTQLPRALSWTEINQVLGRQRTARQLEAAAAAGIPPLAAVPSAVARTPGGKAGTPPDGAAVRGSGPEGLPGTDIREIREIYPVSGGADVRPKTLSWAFQQDARRYDGGFQLYG